MGRQHAGTRQLCSSRCLLPILRAGPAVNGAGVIHQHANPDTAIAAGAAAELPELQPLQCRFDQDELVRVPEVHPPGGHPASTLPLPLQQSQQVVPHDSQPFLQDLNLHLVERDHRISLLLPRLPRDGTRSITTIIRFRPAPGGWFLQTSESVARLPDLSSLPALCRSDMAGLAWCRTVDRSAGVRRRPRNPARRGEGS